MVKTLLSVGSDTLPLVISGTWPLTMRAPASIGAADLLAIRPLHYDRPDYYPSKGKNGCEVILVQVKANKDGGPYANFRPKERGELLADAIASGGQGWLVHWPPHGKPSWIHSSEWPT